MNEIPILYMDADVLVADKPAGINSEGQTERDLPVILQRQCGGTIFPVHRLDRETRGCIAYARSAAAAKRLSAAITGGELHKRYYAIVEGEPAEPSAVLSDLLYHDVKKNKSYVVTRLRRSVREAELSYETVATAETERGKRSLVSICLHTGRTHQIRVQFASRRLPLLGDTRYGSAERGVPMALLAQSLSFPHPTQKGKTVAVSLPFPEEYPWQLFAK